jgi:hypothetical protein
MTAARGSSGSRVGWTGKDHAARGYVRGEMRQMYPEVLE